MVQALQNEDKIVSVEPLEDGSGYTVTFSQSGTITIHNGETPDISVKLDDDGKYYWTIGSEYLLDEQGNKVPATSGVPQIRVQDGDFELSFDGTNWQKIGSAGGAGLLEDVIEEGNDVYFVLTNGTVITIPKVQVQEFALNISKTEYAVSAGAKFSVNYSVTAGDDGTVITGYGTNGYAVKFSSVNSAIGNIEITVPDPLVDGQVAVFAVKSTGEVSGKVLTFTEGILTVDDSLLSIVPAEGGELSVIVITNMSYSISVPANAKTWIEYNITKSLELREEVVTFTIAKNYAASVRSAAITVLDEMGNNVSSFTITQAAGTGEKEPGY